MADTMSHLHWLPVYQQSLPSGSRAGSVVRFASSSHAVTLARLWAVHRGTHPPRIFSHQSFILLNYHADTHGVFTKRQPSLPYFTPERHSPVFRISFIRAPYKQMTKFSTTEMEVQVWDVTFLKDCPIHITIVIECRKSEVKARN